MADARTDPRFEGWACNDRTAGFACLACATIAGVVRVLPEDNVCLALVKLLFATIAAGVLPGLLLAILWRPVTRWNATQLLAIAVASSLAIVQVPCVLSLLLHWPVLVVAWVWLAILALLGLWLTLFPRQDAILITLCAGERTLLVALLAVPFLLYLKGSPFHSHEEQMHVSIVRRLAAHPAPALDNYFLAPGIVYTHPFPGTHYFMALCSEAGGIDCLFVYHKLRSFWGFATLLFLYQIARMAFGRTDYGLASFWAAIALVLNGTFADVGDYYWAQLVPYSHASDVAMGTLLPSLMYLGFAYLTCRGRRLSWFLLVLTLASVAMLTMAHIRETVQFLIYCSCYFLAALLYRRPARSLVRCGLLICCVVVICLAYGTYHRQLVGHVAELDGEAKGKLLAEMAATPIRDLLLGSEFIRDQTSLYLGWFPLAVLLGPLALLVFSRRAIVLLMCGSTFAFLLVFRVPAFGMLLTLGTYFEMLMTPVRNYSFFTCVMLGPMLYLIASTLARLPVSWMVSGTASGAGLLLAMAGRLPVNAWRAGHGLFFGSVLAMYCFALAVTLWPRGRRWVEGLRVRPAPALAAPAFAALLVPLAWLSASPSQSPLSIRSVPSASPHFCKTAPIMLTPAAALEGCRPGQLPSWRLSWGHTEFKDSDAVLTGLRAHAPPVQFSRWARKALPIDAVLAVNTFNACPLTMFVPQRVTAWPCVACMGLVSYRIVFPGYAARLRETLLERGGQPFFDSVETVEARDRFVQELKVTHIIVDPACHALLMPGLLSHPERYKLLYDEGNWAALEVIPAPPHGVVRNAKPAP